METAVGAASGSEEMQAARRARWHQTATDRIADPEDAVRLIAAAGVATLYPASPEIPNLFHAYTGDPASKIDSGHSSPSGEVYGWRWALGRREAAFYSVLARGRPTWVGWSMLPAVLRLCGETRSPDELFRAGEISADAQRIARVLGVADDALSTGELRRQAGFPTGKPQRAAYLKAVDELDTRLLLAKVFSAAEDDIEMRHALVRTRYPDAVGIAAGLSREAALDTFLAAYLPLAVYAVPAVLAKDLRLPDAVLRAGLDRMVGAGRAATLALPGQKGGCYLWADRWS